jgi:hypothetical protein
LADAAKNGNGLRTELTVNGNVHAQAVLIPRVDVNRIFGKEIAQNYAVIEVNVGNKSPNAALIIHGIFIDYSRWPLSGSTKAELNALGSTDAFQASNVPSQVASEEYRVVRGQLLDAQTDTWRNRLMRWLTLAGNLAGAFTFSINEQGIVKGIAAATGVGIPGVATAWPDRTIEQLNRVSDFGFHSPKLVPKEGSEVIVCFFPIDRFLTPGFRKLFLKSPALFFAPLQMLVDKTVKNDVDAAVGDLLRDTRVSVEDLREKLPCYMEIAHGADAPGFFPCLREFGLEMVKDPTTNEKRLRVIGSTDANGNPTANPTEFEKFKKFMVLEFIRGVSLNRVTVTIDGVMSVDVNTIAARVDEVHIDKVADCGDAGSECFWTNLTAGGGVRTGVIRGAYMQGGDIAIAEKDALGITDLKKIDDGSTNDQLRFSFKLTKPIHNQTKLHFTVLKPGSTADAKQLESNSFEYLVAFSPQATGIDATRAGNAVTVTKDFGPDFDPANLAVTLISEAGDEVRVPAASLTPAPTNTQIVIANVTGISGVRAGCWYVQVQSGGLSSNRSARFAIAPTPTLTSAERNDKFLLVKGNDLIDFSHCGGQQVSFQLQQGTATPVAVDVVDWNNGKPVLTLPEAAKTGTWKVQVLLNGTLVTTNGEAELKPISQ